MKRYTKYIALGLITLFAIIATFSSMYYPPLNNRKHNFHTKNVVDDIAVIAQTPHSVEHPNERAKVRDYLVKRLKEMGGNVRIYHEDSVKNHVTSYTHVDNIIADFPPSNTNSRPYILLIAHYDSRFAQDVRGQKVYSYGAADDGYGVGICLELARGALTYKNEWANGIRILLTDCEEPKMVGMKTLYDNHPELFEDVALACNIDARGVKGPALLFETSPSNNKLMELYKHAQYPYGYSLTAAVYEVLPNNTDFSIIKNDITGLNFSVIDDLKYYHTDKDHFDNISPRSIAHYGGQLAPIVKEFLTNPSYSKDSFKGDEDAVYFTIPPFGMFLHNRTTWLITNLIILLLSIWALVIMKRRGRLKFGNTWKEAGITIGIAIAWTCIGTLVAYLASKAYGLPFNPVDIRYVGCDNILLFLLLTGLVTNIVMIWKRMLFNGSGTIITLMLLSILSYLFLNGENFFFLIPLLCISSTIVLYRFIHWNIWGYFALVQLLLYAVSFGYIFYTALTIGSVGILLFAGCYVSTSILCILNYLDEK